MNRLSACGGDRLNCETHLFYDEGEVYFAIITTKDIKFGTELTWNYSKYFNFVCPCGACKAKYKSPQKAVKQGKRARNP